MALAAAGGESQLLCTLAASRGETPCQAREEEAATVYGYTRSK